MEQTYITLNDGTKIPQFGPGVFQIPGDEDTKEACMEAFMLGYRRIDTVHAYQNERGGGQEVLAAVTINPSVLQLECHPYYQQNDLKKRIAPYNTVIESWYLLGHGDAALIEEPVFTKLAEKYGKTNAQIILRWHI